MVKSNPDKVAPKYTMYGNGSFLQKLPADQVMVDGVVNTTYEYPWEPPTPPPLPTQLFRHLDDGLQTDILDMVGEYLPNALQYVEGSTRYYDGDIPGTYSEGIYDVDTGIAKVALENRRGEDPSKITLHELGHKYFKDEKYNVVLHHLWMAQNYPEIFLSDSFDDPEARTDLINSITDRFPEVNDMHWREAIRQMSENYRGQFPEGEPPPVGLGQSLEKMFKDLIGG